ncbi:MAG: 16S rRNA (adenine(1518)-N(6)/adenine(1519)-N(6))-dimethyltransferase RsmA [Patescibacteria group bacterium]
MIDLSNKTELTSYLKEKGLWAKHGLGQNFLVDRDALDKIIDTAFDTPHPTSPHEGEESLIIEVGPGVGTMTEELVKHAKKVIAVELDEKLKQLLNGYIAELLKNNNITIEQYNNFELINADVLKVNIPELVGDQKYKVVANIPYYITSKILQLFLTLENKPESITLLVQKEVAERICAKPGEMSVLAVSVQVYGEPRIAGIVKKESFFPSPKVDSAILHIAISNFQFPIFNQFLNYNFQTKEAFEKAFFRLVHIGFAARRKTLANNLSNGYHIDKKTAEDIIRSMGFSVSIRAQELSVDDWKKLAKVVLGIT